jgi:plastocyanin
MRFLAPDLTVHKGDVLNFLGGFHTATAIPANQDPGQWIADNTGLGEPYALQESDPDEGLAALKYNNAVVFPSSQTCGPPAAGAPPCSYDGTSVVNSGLLFFTTNFDGPQPAGGFSMSVDANPGDVFYVVCLIHPAMMMKVTVAPESTTATSQTDINTYQDGQLFEDAQTASALIDTYKNKHTSKRLGHGHRRWNAWAGVDAPGVSVYDQFPDKVTADKGDTIRWHFDQLIYEIHTATIPNTLANEINAEDFAFVCDPDGDSGSSPDTDADFSTGSPVCPAGSELEVDTSPRFLPTIGDGKWTGGNDEESSGARNPYLPSPPTNGGAPWDVKMSSKTSAKGQKYACAVHPNMVAKFVVR